MTTNGETICLLGVDPGSRVTGFGVITTTPPRVRYLASGCVRTGQGEMPERLREIYQGIDQIIEQHQPTVLAVEKVFMHKNADSALKLGQARGAAIVAAVNRGLRVYEYTANQIKQTVSGQGHADKRQIQHMVKILLNLPSAPPSDAADALAAAICHAQHARNPKLLAG